MSFIAGMPESGSTLGNTRKLFVNELAGMRKTATTNHIDQNDTGGNAGKHTFGQFTNVSPGITGGTELALYNKTVSSNQRLFIRQPTTGTEIQISGVDPVTQRTGCVFLPGGLLLQWGSSGIVKNTLATSISFEKQGADGFVLLRVLDLSTTSSDVTCGYAYNLGPAISPNDGFYVAIPKAQSTLTSFSYMVIGTLT